MTLMIFNKKKRTIDVGGKTIELEPPRKGIAASLFGKKPAARFAGTPPAAAPKPATAPQPQQVTATFAARMQSRAAAPKKQAGPAAGAPKNTNRVTMYISSIGAKHKGLETALREQGIKESLYEFVKRMLIASVALSVVIAVAMLILFIKLGMSVFAAVLFSAVLGISIFYTALGTFLNYPTQKGKVTSKNIERDILFAARDMIISLRSGMPLFNAITSISVGYGDASKEFARIVERVQLGTPLEDAIDQTVSETKSKSFRRMMLQASVSIRAGADVVGALQSVIDQLAEERVIELRRYGQSLNAIAMFYMLFGIILPSMGVAVVTILTTFVAIFTMNDSVLEFVIVGLIFLQIIFLQMIRNSRPVFTL